MKNHLIEGIVVGLLVFLGSSLEAEPPRLPTLKGMGGMGAATSPEISPLDDDPIEGRRPLAELLSGLKSKDLATRRKAATGLYWKPQPLDPAAIPPLIDALRDEDEVVREKVIRALGNYGHQAKAAVPPLLEIVKKKEDKARLDAVATLGKIGPEAQVAVPLLVEMLAEKSYLRRAAAAEALGGIGRAARTAIKPLRGELTDHAPPVRVAAAFALWRISGSAHRSVPVLIAVLQNTNLPNEAELAVLEISEDFGIPLLPMPPRNDSRPRPEPVCVGPRQDAAHALGEMGQDARVAIPALQKVMKEESGWVQIAAVLALVQIDHKTVGILSALRLALREDEPLIRYKAVECLGRLACADKAKEALPLLVTALGDEEGLVRGIAVMTIARIGPEEAERAVPKLLIALQSEDLVLSEYAALTLNKIGSPAKTAVPQLVELLRDKNADKRRVAAIALAGIGRKAMAAVPDLVNNLRDSDEKVRLAAAYALRRIDPSALLKKKTEPR